MGENNLRLDFSYIESDLVQRCHGSAGMQALLLPAYDHDTCGSDREVTQVSLLGF